ncbi:hypothetical protein [Nocardia africana]
MNAEDLRAEVIAVAAQEIASWESDPTPNSRHFACAEGIANALAAAGMLPADIDYQTNMAIRDGHRVPVVSRRYVTHYREIQR